MPEKIKQFDFKLFTSITVVCTTVMLAFGYSDLSLGWNSHDFHHWQLFTAHFVHYDFSHLLTNMLALGILLYLFPVSFKSNVIGIVLAIVMIDLYLYFADVKYYIGYSGLLYLIPGIACVKYISQKKYSHALLIAIIYIVYTSLSSEDYYISKELIWKPLKQAHFSGFVAGLLSKSIIQTFK